MYDECDRRTRYLKMTSDPNSHIWTERSGWRLAEPSIRATASISQRKKPQLEQPVAGLGTFLAFEA